TGTGRRREHRDGRVELGLDARVDVLLWIELRRFRVRYGLRVGDVAPDVGADSHRHRLEHSRDATIDLVIRAVGSGLNGTKVEQPTPRLYAAEQAALGIRTRLR